MILRALAYAFVALWSARCAAAHGRALGVGRGEWSRYLKKAIFCSWCYVDLAAARRFSQLRAIGEAGFLTAAFDVLTDWRTPDDTLQQQFARLVRAYEIDGETRRLAGNLYDRKRTGGFAHDGLDRGVLALELVLRSSGALAMRLAQWGTLDEVGRALQLVDDMLDVEQDRAQNEVNCLLGPNATHHAGHLIELSESGQFRSWFGTDRSMLNLVIGRAVSAARQHIPPAAVRRS